MEAGLLPKGWCNTTGTYVQTTQHVRHTHASGSWSAEVLQKTSSNWTWVQTKRLSEKRTESAVAFQRVWMCMCIGGCSLVKSIFTFQKCISEVFAAIRKYLCSHTEVSDFVSVTTETKQIMQDFNANMDAFSSVRSG